jgi:hypothetical protein
MPPPINASCGAAQCPAYSQHTHFPLSSRRCVLVQTHSTPARAHAPRHTCTVHEASRLRGAEGLERSVAVAVAVAVPTVPSPPFAVLHRGPFLPHRRLLCSCRLCWSAWTSPSPTLHPAHERCTAAAARMQTTLGLGMRLGMAWAWPGLGRRLGSRALRACADSARPLAVDVHAIPHAPVAPRAIYIESATNST